VIGIVGIDVIVRLFWKFGIIEQFWVLEYVADDFYGIEIPIVPLVAEGIMPMDWEGLFDIACRTEVEVACDDIAFVDIFAVFIFDAGELLDNIVINWHIDWA
jgi:hypothetical protein